MDCKKVLGIVQLLKVLVIRQLLSRIKVQRIWQLPDRKRVLGS
jgi:hypothetical protein